MNEPARKLRYTFAEYLEREAKSEVKHEYVNGEIFAMAGGTIEHSRLSVNVAAELRGALRGKPCNVFNTDLRHRVLATGLATYPEVSVVCGQAQRDPQDDHAVTNPVLLAEVLSDSTESYDRNEKWAHYRRIPSLRDYLLVSQYGRRIEHYHRNEDGTWTLRDARPGDVIDVAAIGVRLSVDDIYFDPAAEA